LDQGWAVEAGYQLLDRKKPYPKIIQSKYGEITYKEICKIWPKNNDNERKLFIGFLLDAELCFETADASKCKEFSQRQFVVSQLMKEERPVYIADYIEKDGLTENQTIDYRFLPAVFMHRFIVRVSELATVEDMWQSGI